MLDNLKAAFTGTGRVYTIVATVLIVMIGLGLLIFYRFTILPPLKLREELISRVGLARSEAIKAESSAAAGSSSQELLEEIEATKAELQKQALGFLTEAQAAEVLDKLYQYTEESDVEILRLESKPSAGEEGQPSSEGEGQPSTEGKGEASSEDKAQPAPEAKKNELYDTRAFQVEVMGMLPDLTDFVSRIKEASRKSVRIDNVNIPESEQEPHHLTMDITIYTSPYALAGAEQAASGTTPESLSYLYDSLAIAWSAAEWDKAIKLISHVLAIEPDHAGMVDRLYAARVNLGYELLDKGENQKATTQFTLALQIKPDGPEALAGLQRMPPTPAGSMTVSPTELPDPTKSPNLVRPKNWPTNWPWLPNEK